MQIIKKINTSAALALDSTGQQVVVLGKGIGFPPVPYELTDMNKIERTFYDVDPKYLSMIRDLSQPVVMACAEIADQAEIELDCRLNPNLPFTLADHVQFALERLKNGVDLTKPIAYDVRHLYPKETALAQDALKILQDQTGCSLPENEVVNIAMHLINAEAEGGNIHSLMMSMQIISQVDSIVENSLHFKLDKDSYNYNRFTAHLRYLIQRLEAGTPSENVTNQLRRTLMREHPEIYACVMKVVDYFKKTWDWTCSDDEVVYLIMHVQRVYERSDKETK